MNKNRNKRRVAKRPEFTYSMLVGAMDNIMNASLFDWKTVNNPPFDCCQGCSHWNGKTIADCNCNMPMLEIERKMNDVKNTY